MGKSLGNTFEHRDLMSRFGPDAVRYYFLTETEFGKDGDFSEGRFIDIINAHLANTIGKSRASGHHIYGEIETLEKYASTLLIGSSSFMDC